MAKDKVGQNIEFDNLEHTQRLSNRTYMKIYSSADFPEGETIYSEGAWRIQLFFSRETGSTALCWLSFDGQDEVQLPPDAFAAAAPALPTLGMGLQLGGDPSVIRDDEIRFRFEDAETPGYVIVLFDRIVWKKDDNFYPAQAADRKELNKLNAEGVQET